MAVRFKFRSSLQFDSVDIGGQPSISVCDLKSKIVRHKNLNISQDLDLVLCDAVTGREYTDEDFKIPTGSSLIIKRVPSGLLHSATLPHNNFSDDLKLKKPNSVETIGSRNGNEEMDAFDDFGVDLFPVPELISSDCNLDLAERYNSSADKTDNVSRCLGPSILRCQLLEASDVSEVFPKGPAHGGVKVDAILTKPKPKVEEHFKLEAVVNTNPPSRENTDLPSELKCSLCYTFFKEAMMIPCCQHSFCEKCIRAVLVEKAMCPKCFSTKCRAEDLLPNVSLRQAIDHFRESQILLSGSDNAFPGDAPDVESGIQARDVSCAMSIIQREPDLPHSPSATGMGSNQMVADSAYDSVIKNNARGGVVRSRNSHLCASKSMKLDTSQNLKHNNGEKDRSSHHEDIKSGPQADFQGENQPTDFHQTIMHEEADSTIKRKRGLQINTTGIDKNFVEAGRNKKGDRTCYMCGSPDHFIRDCPAASSPHPMLQTGNAMFHGALPGYVSPYWNGTPLPCIRPFANVYCNPGMMPFNATMVPATPYAVPPYVTSMYGGSPDLGGYMRMGVLVPPAGTNAEHHPSRMKCEDPHGREKRWKLSDENIRRQQSFDEDDDFDKSYHHGEMGRLRDDISHRDRGKSLSCSEDSCNRNSRRKHQCDKCNDNFLSADERHERSSRCPITGRDPRSYHHQRSSAVVEDMSNISNWHTEERHSHSHSHRTSKKHGEGKVKCSSDSSRSCHRKIKERDFQRKGVDSDAKRDSEKHRSLSESGIEATVSSDEKEIHKKKDSCFISRRSRHSEKHKTNELSSDRWQMVTGSDDDCSDYHHHKLKRVH